MERTAAAKCRNDNTDVRVHYLPPRMASVGFPLGSINFIHQEKKNIIINFLATEKLHNLTNSKDNMV